MKKMGNLFHGIVTKGAALVVLPVVVLQPVTNPNPTRGELGSPSLQTRGKLLDRSFTCLPINVSVGGDAYIMVFFPVQLCAWAKEGSVEGFPVNVS